MSDIIFEDYQSGGGSVEEIKVKNLQRIEISYDGGRLSVYIDGVKAYGNMCSGDDFHLTINPRY
ncbi:hypothetical protein ASswx1_30 [Aeromonas phage Asswx_1]|uniref:Uncharacterized protein n=1 Tax=Aeromonas phage Asswx_1 TaxID=2419739 RepID=A0A411B7S6_9CAUD|nr:hypothetical protein ASswx1_30 [Aeromonas phage Asswx_1]